jgi:acyl carrier protein
MLLNEFIAQFEEQVDEIETGTITADTAFRELKEWDSMAALSVIAFIDRKFNKQLTGDDLSKYPTVGQLFNFVSA